MPDVEDQGSVEVRKWRPRKSRYTSRRASSKISLRDGIVYKPPPTCKYGDTSATYWNLYASEAEMNDSNLVKSLMGNTSSMVLLNSLFSSIVASFIIEIYKTLIPTSSGGQQTADNPSSSAVRINVVLFLSFFLSIMSALSCSLIQLWCNEYLKFAHPRAAPHNRGRIRTYLFKGFRKFQMRRFMYGTHVLLHISVFLFFWALSDFFYTVHHHFGLIARYALVVSGIVYILLSILPMIFSSCPYNTPMTPPLRSSYIILRIVIRSPLLFLRWCHSQPCDLTGLRYYKGIHFDRARLYSIKAEEQAEKLEFYAMGWLFTEDDFSDKDMDKFLEGLPGYMSSSHTKTDRLDQYLTADHILSRIREHFITCATSVELSDKGSITRVSFSVKALWLIFQYSRKRKKESSVPGEFDKELQSQRAYIEGLMNDFQALCDINDPTIALRASCIRALAIQGLLSQLVPQNSKTKDSSRFPASIIPIYTFFFPNDNTDVIRQLNDGRTPSAVEIKTIWESLLHDGPLANLTTLAQAIRNRDHAPPETLSFCWKALDILLTQIRTVHSKEPPRASRVQNVFDKLHENTREYVNDDERGFRVRPLLDILDIVARGRRLLMVFSSQSKYHNKADVVFEKEDLRNDDLLEAFAQCLPHYISKNSPDLCRDFMEKVVRHDNLWTSLQANLWNTQRSDSPIPEKLRVFEDCCTVINIAFSVLEDSREVDWRSPEFVSLSQHFDSFIAHLFQDTLMGRATSFRIGVIKARFCKALLAQFWNDLKCEGTVFFQSQWDVASLTTLIHVLDLRDKEDAEFWNSYVSGGHIGAQFTAKALEMINRTARDGPLLIFCLLGHLAAAAVPLNQSGLESEDIEEVWELQRKVIQKRSIPLNCASETAWEALGQLREQVNGLRGKRTGIDTDSESLHPLLLMIDAVFELRISDSEGPGQGEPVKEEGPTTSVAVASTSSSGKSACGIHDRFSFASESTAVSRRPFSCSQTDEGEDGSGKRPVDRVFDLERKASSYVRSESPQCYESGPHSLSSTFQDTPSVGIMDRSIGTPPSAVIPSVTSMGDVRQRRFYPPPGRSGLRFSTTPPSLVSRESTVALFTMDRDVHTVLPNSEIGSPRGSFDLSDDGQLGAAPTSEE